MFYLEYCETSTAAFSLTAPGFSSRHGNYTLPLHISRVNHLSESVRLPCHCTPETPFETLAIWLLRKANLRMPCYASLRNALIFEKSFENEGQYI